MPPKASKAAADSKSKATTKAMPKSSAKATTKTKTRGVEKKKKGIVISPFNTYEATPELTLSLAVSDPNAPKRGLSAYMFFANDQRENVREENPGISFGIHTPIPHLFSGKPSDQLI
jgi:hypothetical protein